MESKEYWDRVFLLKEVPGRRDGLKGVDFWCVMEMFGEIEALYENRWPILCDEREVGYLEEDLRYVLLSMRFEVDERIRGMVVGAVEDMVVTVDILIGGWFKRLGLLGDGMG